MGGGTHGEGGFSLSGADISHLLQQHDIGKLFEFKLSWQFSHQIRESKSDTWILAPPKSQFARGCNNNQDNKPNLTIPLAAVPLALPVSQGTFFFFHWYLSDQRSIHNIKHQTRRHREQHGPVDTDR
jgi:hypothetical protein